MPHTLNRVVDDQWSQYVLVNGERVLWRRANIFASNNLIIDNQSTRFIRVIACYVFLYLIDKMIKITHRNLRREPTPGNLQYRESP